MTGHYLDAMCDVVSCIKPQNRSLRILVIQQDISHHIYHYVLKNIESFRTWVFVHWFRTFYQAVIKITLFG